MLPQKRQMKASGRMFNKRPKKKNPVVNPKKNENSAAVLSLWHCIFSWFYMNCERQHSDDKTAMETMEEVYGHMKALRHTIQTAETFTFNVDLIVSHFQFLVGKINQKRWNSVIKSMMHELMEMLRVLKGDKQEFLKDWAIDDIDEVKTSKLKHFACLLTLWYWLAAWSDSDQDSSDDLRLAKVHYFQNVETYTIELNYVLFIDSHRLRDDETMICEDFQKMVSSLGIMLKADPQHWIDVLDHFIHRMAHAGSLRGQVKNVWHHARVQRDDHNKKNGKKSADQVTENEPSREVVEDIPKETPTNGDAEESRDGGEGTPSDHSEPLLVHGLGLLLKNVVRRTPLTAIADKIPDAVSFVYDDLKKGDIKDIADHIPNVVGEIAGPEAKHIAQAVVQGAEFVSEHLGEGVKEVAHVLGEGVHEFSKGVHTVFHSVKNFFSHLF